MSVKIQTILAPSLPSLYLWVKFRAKNPTSICSLVSKKKRESGREKSDGLEFSAGQKSRLLVIVSAQERYLYTPIYSNDLSHEGLRHSIGKEVSVDAFSRASFFSEERPLLSIAACLLSQYHQSYVMYLREGVWTKDEKKIFA